MPLKQRTQSLMKTRYNVEVKIFVEFHDESTAESVEAVEYTDCISAEDLNPSSHSQRVSWICH